MAVFRLYNNAKTLLAQAGVNWASAGTDIRAALVDSSYVFDPTHVNLSDVSAHVPTNGRTPTLANKSCVAGVCDADDPAALASVPSGVVLGAVILYIFNASDASAKLIAYTNNVTGLGTTNGANVSITWDNGPNKIFSLSDV